ncbi:MAG: hypothetical protein HKN46_04150, partial [Acidimicrobiia bacterium]|nr:hypothetical protein [Acidimicrobiia bacterium]
AERRSHQYFATAGWTGYPVANATVQSTKSATSLAAAWATTQHLGIEGYRRLTEDSWAATKGVIDAVEGSDRVHLLTPPDAPLFAVTSADVFTHAQAMRERGWQLGATPSLGPSPAHLHFTMTAGHLTVLDELVRDLLETAPLEPSELGGALAGLDLAALEPAMIGGVLDMLDLDKDRAVIDAAIDGLEPEARAAVISAFIQQLYA